MEAMCHGPGMDGTLTATVEQKELYGHSVLSSWSLLCTPGTAVCALKTKVEEPSLPWDIDNAALTDARLYCCEY